MRGLAALVAVAVAACGSSGNPATDAGPGGDAAEPDAPPACEKKLLVGGTDVVAQGWSVMMMPPATLSNGADYAALHTSTNAGATSSGQLLLRYPGAVEAGKPFKLQIVMLVEQVAAHNPLDSAAAILASFTGAFGTTDERAQMIYLDSDQIGWADQTQDATAAVTNGAYHTYVLSVDAAGTAEFSVDGTPALMRVNLAVDGAITIGDQTNDAGLDSTLRIRSVTRLCL